MDIYIANLRRGTCEEELRATFSQLGKIKAIRIVQAAEGGHAKDFAVISLEAAIKERMNTPRTFNALETA
jgi:hypothetical protein